MRYLLVMQHLNPMRQKFYMPLGLPYINGAMRSKGFDVEAINLQYVEGDPIEALKECIIKKKIGAVLCGGLTTQYGMIKEIFDAAKSVNPEIITIGGGGGFSSEPILFSEMTGVDFAVIGEGEVTNCELAYALDHGGSVDGILGLVRKTDSGYVYSGERPYIRNLDSVAFPSYEGLSLDKYLEGQSVDGWYHTYTFFSDNPRMIPMLLARSCPFSCKFCYHPIGRGYRSRSLDNFFEELDLWIETYDINAIVLIDECFSIKPERVLEFCKRIKPYHLSWACQMRVETYSDEILEVMVDAGCVSATFGLESMSQKVLDDMNKKATIAQLQEALESSYHHGGGASGNIIFGAEAETVETVEETMEWWKHNKKFRITDFAMVGTYPGSAYYENAVKKGILKDKKKFIEDGCPFINITQMSDKQYKILAAFARFKDTEVRNKGKVISAVETDGGVNAELECSHCGYKNYYKGIQKTSYQSGILRALACRECHNFSDYVFDEDTYKESWNVTKWLYGCLTGKEGQVLQKYMVNHNYKRVALYGVGLQVKEFVELLMDKFREAGVEVAYGIDRQSSSIQVSDFPVYGLDAPLEQVDATLVVPVYYFNTIYNNLREKTDMDIVSLEEVFA